MAQIAHCENAMNWIDLLGLASALAPATLMLAIAIRALLPRARLAETGQAPWAQFIPLSIAALVAALLSLGLQFGAQPAAPQIPLLKVGALSAAIALLVQLLGTVIVAFSARYLQGESGQPRYIAALAAVLAAVHVLLLADHWLLLIGAWALAGRALQHLLCFYPDRPFAQLAAHKKQIADRAADLLLLGAAIAAYLHVGSGSISELLGQLDGRESSLALQVSAVCLVLAVILRTALLPVHGWLIQVMEAPTPVSALLHAGVVNLGGFVLIRFSALLEASPVARWLLVIFGLGTALLAGFVMLTRISVKVRLAWSTVAQMGFMVLECGLGLYQFAALHLIGHSLYKAHTFLAASGVVQQTRLRMLAGAVAMNRASLIAAPALAAATIALVQRLATDAGATWPWWWSALLALAWAPVFWLPQRAGDSARATWQPLSTGVAIVAVLALAVTLGHAVPLGLHDTPHTAAGIAALAGMALMYAGLAILQWHRGGLGTWRRWSYAGFYIDEFYTRLTLRLWPTHWSGASADTQRQDRPAARITPVAP
jgi:NAD(P)H-quinone oxidoreductase subunit 5